MSNNQNTDVIVVGAGPVGLVAGCELARRGVRVRVIDKLAQPTDQSRAIAVHARSLDMFDRMGIVDEMLATGVKAIAMQMHTGGRDLFRVPFGEVDSAFPFTLTTAQTETERVLNERLQSFGVTVERGVELIELSQDDDGVIMRVRGRGGARYDIRARYVLGCDGAAGGIRDQIGARYAGRSDPRPNFNLVFRAPSLDTPLGPAVQYWVLGAIPGLVGRLDLAGTWWAVIPGIEAAYGAAHASDLITALLGAPVPHELVASDPWTAHMMIADRFRDRRVFLVGESAHLNPPWGGHGFNTCVGDAVNIAWKIAAVEQGWASPELLDSYDPERRGVVEQTVASAEANMRSLAGELPPDGPAIQLAKRPEFHSLGLVLGYSYAGSPVIQPTAHHRGLVDVTHYTPSTEPGARLPHRWLPDGSSLYDRLGPGFSLVGPVRAAGPGVTTLTDLARRKGIPLSLVESQAHQAFLLVRPDQHIAGRADDAADLDLDLATGNRGTGIQTVSAVDSSASGD